MLININKSLPNSVLKFIGLAAFFIPSVNAQFDLNFVPTIGTVSTSMFQGGEEDGSTLDGQTPFLFHGESLEIVTDPETGERYYHMIVGSAAEGFLQESYIEVNSVPGSMQLNDAGILSSSGTNVGDNGHDPLGIVIGNINAGIGQANPRKVIMRQIVSDGEIMMEFRKDEFLKKPLINQVQVNSDIAAIFQLDMRNSSYDDDTTAATIVNIQRLSDEKLDGLADFNMATDIQNSDVNAGRYTYLNGTGNNGAEGTYEYIDGDFKINDVKWENFFDHSADNPWGYTDLRPTP